MLAVNKFLLLSVLILLSCTSASISLKKATETDQQKCLNIGGKWLRLGNSPLPPKKECLLPTKDKGRACSSDTDCESVCVSKEKIKISQPVQGKCYDWNNIRGQCLNRINHGLSLGEICSD